MIKKFCIYFGVFIFTLLSCNNTFIKAMESECEKILNPREYKLNRDVYIYPKGTAIQIEDSCKKIWKVESLKSLILKQPSLITITAIILYLRELLLNVNNEIKNRYFAEAMKGSGSNLLSLIPEDHHGSFYYGKIDGSGVCVHSTWVD